MAWFAADASAWEEDLEDRARPLKRTTVLLDLRHLENQVRLGRPFPTRSELEKRWGWGNTAVRNVLKSDWHDPERPVDVETLIASRCRRNPKPTQRQPIANPIPNGATPAIAEVTTQTGPIGNPERGHTRVPSPNQEPEPEPVLVVVEHDDTPSEVETRRAQKRPTKATPMVHEAWMLELEAAFGVSEYPWRFVGRDHDGSKVKRWLKQAKVNDANPTPGVERLRVAFRSYFQAVNAGTAWPPGPATTDKFDKDIAGWLRADGSHRSSDPVQAWLNLGG